MVGLPDHRVHRRVLADLDRPARKGGDTDSLRTELPGHSLATSVPVEEPSTVQKQICRPTNLARLVARQRDLPWKPFNGSNGSRLI
jgi:hypothetical protein